MNTTRVANFFTVPDVFATYRDRLQVMLEVREEQIHEAVAMIDRLNDENKNLRQRIRRLEGIIGKMRRGKNH